MTDTEKPIKIDNHTGNIAVHSSVAIKFPTQFENHLFTHLSILGKLTSGFFGTTITL